MNGITWGAYGAEQDIDLFNSRHQSLCHVNNVTDLELLNSRKKKNKGFLSWSRGSDGYEPW